MIGLFQEINDQWLLMSPKCICSRSYQRGVPRASVHLLARVLLPAAVPCVSYPRMEFVRLIRESDTDVIQCISA